MKLENLNKNSPIIRNLLLKRKLLREKNPLHKKIRPVLLILGGCMQGVHGAGAVAAFHKLGLEDAFDAVIGISTGAGIGAYFLAGYKQTLLGASIYYDECLSKNFIDFRRIKKIADIDYIETVLRRGKKVLNIDMIRASRSQFYVGATNKRTGNGELIDVKAAKPDSIAAIKASIAMFFFYGTPVRVNGRDYLDGSFGTPFPVREIITEFNPTDILVLSNGSIREPLLRIIGEEVLAHLSLHKHKKLVRAVHRHHRLLKKGIHYFENISGINKGILSPPESDVSLLTRDKNLLKLAAARSAQKTFRVFGEKAQQIKFL